MTLFDVERASQGIVAAFRDSILPALRAYIEIPAKSPHFDPDWAAHGYLDRTVALAERWCREQPVRGLDCEIIRLPGRTPVLLLEIPGSGDDTVLLYGHLDKQPELEPWAPGLAPWRPVLRDDRLYGRGAADDGYAVFAALTALAQLQAQRIPHARCVVLIETCEESGSFDLPAYLDHLHARIDRPSLVVCLDSGCGDYERLWSTTSLRGLVAGVLRVRVLNEAVHSGDAGGVVPSSFRILRQLLARIEDAETGAILLPGAHTEIPVERVAQAAAAAAVLGDAHWRRFPFVGSTQPIASDGTECVLNRTWRPALEVIGAAGLPNLDEAGNVLRTETAVKLSLRLPPGVSSVAVTEQLRERLEADPPDGADVHFEADPPGQGWEAPPLAPWLAEALEGASRNWFGQKPVQMGEGGTIPFLATLGAAFPDAQILITGVLGPGSNAHGPNEFLHLPTAQRLTGCVAEVLAGHCARHRIR
jgi:acetylornithine deacetylase/succinyl-diaminopimelate desuccinylase-like protein